MKSFYVQSICKKSEISHLISAQTTENNHNHFLFPTIYFLFFFCFFFSRHRFGFGLVMRWQQVIVCHCKFHKSYRRFTTRQHQLIPIFGFGRRAKQQLNNPRHWLSGKGHLSSSNKTASTTALNQPNSNSNNGTNVTNYHPQQQQQQPPPLNQQVPRFQRHLAMNLENDMYYTVDFSDSQHSPLIH